MAIIESTASMWHDTSGLKAAHTFHHCFFIQLTLHGFLWRLSIGQVGWPIRHRDGMVINLLVAWDFFLQLNFPSIFLVKSVCVQQESDSAKSVFSYIMVGDIK